MSALAAPAPTAAVTALTDAAAEAAITAACRTLFLPTIRSQAAPLADAAARERLTHRAYLAEVLSAECDDRESRRRIRRVKEAKFPRTKRLEDFDTAAMPDLPSATLAHLATGAWIDAGQPLVLLGDSGTSTPGQGLPRETAGRPATPRDDRESPVPLRAARGPGRTRGLSTRQALTASRLVHRVLIGVTYVP